MKNLNYSFFLENLQEIRGQIEKLAQPENNREPLYDGAINPELYFNSAKKIVWFLKEAYDDIGGEGGGDYVTKIDEKEFRESLVFGSPKPTWQPIVYVSYGILNDFQFWDDMPYIRKKPEMADVLKQIAIVNIQKLPAKGVTISDNQEINEAFELNKEILRKQIDILNPDIIIAGGTKQWILRLLDVTHEHANERNDSFVKKEHLIITNYHPSARVNRECYVDEIIQNAKKYFQNRI